MYIFYSRLVFQYTQYVIKVTSRYTVSHTIWNTLAVHKETDFFLNLFLYLQLNQTCLLQSTPLHSWYTAPNVFFSSGTRPGTCFAGWREGPVSSFLLSLLSSEIGDLSVRISTVGTEKVRRGQIWRVGRLGNNSCFMLRQKFTDKEWRVNWYIVMVQHPGVVCPHLRPLPSHCHPQTLQNV